MITKHFFKMVMSFIGVLLAGIGILFAVSFFEDKTIPANTAPSGLAPIIHTEGDASTE